MTRLALLLFPSSAFAHPGHGALEMHWHVEDLLWILAFAGIAFLIKRALKK
jgi:heme/copper-type cytochrome/quinol oxidase subunit 3